MAEKEMLVVTSPEIPGRKIVRTLGLVCGNTIRARHVGKDIMAGLRNLVGGEVVGIRQVAFRKPRAGARPHEGQGRKARRQRGHQSAIPNLRHHGWRSGDDGIRHCGGD